MPRNKYRAISCWINPEDGTISEDRIPGWLYCPSKMEALAYKLLLTESISFLYQPQVILVMGDAQKKITPIIWRIDFYLPEYSTFLEMKGVETRDFQLKKKLFDLIYPNSKMIVAKSILELKKKIAELNFCYSKSFHTQDYPGIDLTFRSLINTGAL